MPKTILEVIDLKKHFFHRKGLFSAFSGEERRIPAVDGVSFYLKENETVGLVGESGCGKTTIGRTVLRLAAPTSGRILFDDKDITTATTEQLRKLRGQMQMIFQDLDAALNPKMRIRDIELDATEHTVYQDGKPIPLTLKEFMLLEYFMRHPNQAINREELLSHLWDFNYAAFSNVVDVHVKNLRRKLSRAHADILETVRGVGYRLKE